MKKKKKKKKLPIDGVRKVWTISPITQVKKGKNKHTRKTKQNCKLGGNSE